VQRLWKTVDSEIMKTPLECEFQKFVDSRRLQILECYSHKAVISRMCWLLECCRIDKVLVARTR
jgi:hypothetical protein